jgi:hypothetical protein
MLICLALISNLRWRKILGSSHLNPFLQIQIFKMIFRKLVCLQTNILIIQWCTLNIKINKYHRKQNNIHCKWNKIRLFCPSN